MPTIGIVAEFNPYHNGHSYLINEAVRIVSEETGEKPGVIICMSGNFVQRGTPAILDKYSRAASALDDADLVFEIPVLWAANDAGHFAACGVNMLSRMNVDYIAFGIEAIQDLNSQDMNSQDVNSQHVNSQHVNSMNETIKVLKTVSRILSNEDSEFKKLLKAGLSSGMSYPAARTRALSEYMGIDSKVISSPNNILALEYLTAINKMHSKLRPIFIPRRGSGYSDDAMADGFSSATAIRKMMTRLSEGTLQKERILQKEGTLQNAGALQSEGIPTDISILENNLPGSSLQIIKNQLSTGRPFIEDSDIMPYIASQLRTRKNDELLSIMGMNRELLNRINKAAFPMSYGELVDYMKTKNITHTRITRLLLQIALNITGNEYFENEHIEGFAFPEYANLLAMRRSASNLVRAIRESSGLKIIDKKSAYVPEDDISTLSWNTDCRTTDLYNEIVFIKTGIRIPSELTSTVIIK